MKKILYSLGAALVVLFLLTILPLLILMVSLGFLVGLLRGTAILTTKSVTERPWK